MILHETVKVSTGMANKIHPTAIVGKKVVLGEGNSIGPHVVIEDGVTIGSGNKIGPGAIVFGGTTMGDNNTLHAGVIVGDVPQDHAFQDVESFVMVGNGNVFREYVTIHRGTKAHSTTVIGNSTFLMGYTHVAHNCTIGDNVTTVNTVVLGGHVVVERQAFISASVVIHQFCRIGRLAILSGLSAVNQDVPPFVVCGGRPASVNAINVVGLRRAGMGPGVRKDIKQAFKALYRSGLNITSALEKIAAECSTEEVTYFSDFVKQSSRGIASFSSDAHVRF